MAFKFNPFTGTFDLTASPGGSDTQVQFNSSGSFGGSANFVWDGTKGVLTNSTILTIGNPSGGSITQQNGAFGLPAQGNFYDFNVYAYKTSGGHTVFSAVPLDISASDDGSFNNFRWQLSWGAVAGATGYIVVVVEDDYSGFYGDHYKDVGNVTSYNYDGSSISTPAPTVTPSSPGTFYDLALSVVGSETVTSSVTVGAGAFVTGFSTMSVTGLNSSTPAALTLQAGAGTRNSANNFLSTNALLVLRSSDTSNPNMITFGAGGYVGASDGSDTYGMIDYLGRWLANPGLNTNYGPFFIDASMIVSTRVATGIGFVLRGQTSQSGDLLQFQNVSGNNLFVVNAAGKFTRYNNISTVSNGVPSEYATVDLTTQGAAISATTLYTPTASGMFRISWIAKVTRAGTVSSVLGGTNGFQVKYTDADDSVVVTTGALANENTLALSTNTTQTIYAGLIVVNAKTSTAIQYLMDYTSAGATSMQYNLHIKLEAL